MSLHTFWHSIISWFALSIYCPVALTEYKLHESRNFMSLHGCIFWTWQRTWPRGDAIHIYPKCLLSRSYAKMMTKKGNRRGMFEAIQPSNSTHFTQSFLTSIKFKQSPAELNLLETHCRRWNWNHHATNTFWISYQSWFGWTVQVA